VTQDEDCFARMKRTGSRIILALVSIFLLTLLLSSSTFAQADKKIAYGVLIDNTGSMRSQFDVVVNLSKGIVQQTHQRGPITLFPFKTQGKGTGGLAVISPGIEWSQDKGILDRYIDSIFVVPGQTRLMDGISVIAQQLNAKVTLDKDGFAGKVIFLITDGEDRSSKIDQKELIKMLKESGIQVYAVGLVKEMDNEGGLIRKSTRQKAISFLETMTKATSGRVVFSKSKKPDADELLKELFAKW
jgi:preprotein translocase subunit Sss1